jgi:hypothetical protein
MSVGRSTIQPIAPTALHAVGGAPGRISLAAFERWRADADNARAYSEIAESMRMVRGAAMSPELLALWQETIVALVRALDSEPIGR